MMGIMETLEFYFSFPLVQRAMIVGVLIALCSSLLGVTLVLKRFSFIGSGLSHVAFGATAIAAAMNLTIDFFLFDVPIFRDVHVFVPETIVRTILVLSVTIISAILLLRTGQNTKIKGDAAIAMISVGALGIGYLVMNVFARTANLAGDVCTILFGSISILTLTMTEVWLSIGLSILVIAVFLLFYHKIFAVTFDEDFATATGNRAKLYNLILAIVIAVVIVLAMNLVGALLISALVIFPAMSAMRVLKTFKSVTLCSVFLSVFCAALGILISIVADTVVGSTIVAVNIVVFAIFALIGTVTKRA